MTTKTKATKTTPVAQAVLPASAAAPPPIASKGSTLTVPPEARDLPYDKLAAQCAVDGIVSNARSLVSFGSPTFGKLSLTECAGVLKETAKGLNDGDLSAAVTMLSCQAVTLNAMFGELARRAGLNMGENLGATETYMRLALKAQSQCRATLETLAAIKTPPVVFARQANINNGGQQQVNNSPVAPALPDARGFAVVGSSPSGAMLLAEKMGELADLQGPAQHLAVEQMKQMQAGTEKLEAPRVAATSTLPKAPRQMVG